MKLLLLVVAATCACAQGLELSGMGGGGVSFGEEQKTAGVGATGVSVGLAGRIGVDYLYSGRHFLTASYTVEPKTGRTGPFFQAGAGVTNDSLAVVFAGGATVDVGGRWFIRPQVRLYGHVGPTLMLVPALAAGWRF